MPDLRARSNVEIIDAAFRLYSQNFSIYFALGLIGALPSLVNIVGTQTVQQYLLAHTVTFAIATLVAVIISMIMYGAYILLTADLYHGRPANLERTLSQALRRVIPLFAANVITGFAMMLGFIALIIPGIYVTIRLSMVTPAILLEDVGIGVALSRSFTLTKGHMGRIVLMLVAVFAISIINLLLIRLFPALIPGITGMVVGYLTAACLAPLLSIIWTITYYDLRIRNEGYDIQILAADTPPSTVPSPV
jgi:hypothetical protein